MRRLKFLNLAVIVCASLFFTACESTDDSNDMNSIANVEDIKSTVTSGNWVITLFEEDGVNQTSYFTDYTFVFAATGELSADNGETSLSGAWSITSDSNSSDDDSSSDDDIDFNIFFSSPVNFAEISEDWEIVSYSSSRIELVDESGGDGSVDRLVFEKI